VADEPTAPALAPRFKFLWPTTVELPTKCRRDAVKARVVGAVEAFNSGRTDAFAESFLEAGQLAPTTSVAADSLVGKRSKDSPLSGTRQAMVGR
jgi:hypothetical protein